MNKQKLVRFIDKYYLKGLIQSVVFNSNSKQQKLDTRFVSDDKTLLGLVEMEKVTDFEDATLGIYTTEQLLSLLGVLDDDIKVELLTSAETSYAVKITESASTVSTNYMLSDPSIINQPPKIQNLPEYELEIDITPTVRTKFIAGKSALPDITTFTILTSADTGVGADKEFSSTKLIIGYASNSTNRVTIPVITPKFSQLDNISFNAEYFSKILEVNKECESATLKVSSEGLAEIIFKVDDYTSTYWLVAAAEAD